MSHTAQPLDYAAVIPAQAVAKINFRLVPDQNPSAIDRLFRKHIARVTSFTLRSAVRTDFATRPVLVNRRNSFIRAATVACDKAFGVAPVFVRSGGTIPAVSAFHHVLHMPTVLMGFALPDDRMHSPNEKFHLPNFHRGVAASIFFLAELAAKRGQETFAQLGTGKGESHAHDGRF
jgi:acetylornithine deacetylase/succinyl-diaminopimelate desuccinylase-like protein